MEAPLGQTSVEAHVDRGGYLEFASSGYIQPDTWTRPGVDPWSGTVSVTPWAAGVPQQYVVDSSPCGVGQPPVKQEVSDEGYQVTALDAAAAAASSVPDVLAVPELQPNEGSSVTDPLAQFVQRWNLDGTAVEWLNSLDEAARSTVIAEFAPRCDSRDVMRMLYAFGLSVASRHAADRSMSPELRNFASRWNLDGATVGWLLALQPEVQSVVVQEFAPKEATDHVISKLRAFARSVQMRLVTPTLDPVAQDDLRQRVEEFIANWSLDEDARAHLTSLPAETQVTIMEQFRPKGELANVSAKFMAFVRSVLHGQRALETSVEPSSEAMDAFAAHWGLDDETKAYLCSFPGSLRSRVLEQFDPWDAGQDINTKLKAFTNSLARTSGVDAYGLGASAPWRAQGVVPQKGKGKGKVAFLGAPAAPSFSAGGLLPTALTGATAKERAEVVTFLARWGLTGTAAAEVLERLAPDTRARVMREFAPAPGTRDVFKLLCGFANSVNRTSSAPPSVRPIAPLRVAAPNVLFGGESPEAFAPPSHDGVAVNATSMHDDGCEEFALRWQLDEGSKALLRGLSPETREAVIREFNPRGAIHDIGGKFCSFARTVASRLSGDGMKRSLEVSVAPRSVRPRTPLFAESHDYYFGQEYHSEAQDSQVHGLS